MPQLASLPQDDDNWHSSAEAMAKLAGIRHALRLVDPFGGGPASDALSDDRIAATWSGAGKASIRCFDECTWRTAGAAAAGIDALLAARAAGDEPSEAASRQMADEIRQGLEDLSRRMRLG
jgi:hypothetical protein